MKAFSKPDRHLRKRGEHWHYYRRVPTKFQLVDGRGTIRIALGTSSIETARLRRDELVTADNEYWASLLLAEAASGQGLRYDPGIAEHRYRAACAAAMAAGFTYRPMERLVQSDNIEDVVARLLTLKPERIANSDAEPFKAEALLGGIEEPKLTVSQAFALYVSEIAVDDQYNKSEQQKYQWRKVKQLSINYFIDVVGDIPIAEINREHALKFQRWWSNRMTKPKKGETAVMPNTANRHLGNIRLLYTAYFKHVGEEERPNPFRNMFFKGKTRTEVPAFPDAWVRSKILIPGALTGLRPDLQLITYMLIETGCRPSEIINLRPEHIHLDGQVPHISIKPRRDREIKTESSIRDIPLVGVALEAAKRAPYGFPHYHDKNELFSANMMKAFRTRNFFPSEAHVIYSLRHAFEQRMQEANIDYGLRCLLMGHANSRPAYGDGGSMSYRRDELMKIVHPYAPEIFERVDADLAGTKLSKKIRASHR